MRSIIKTLATSISILLLTGCSTVHEYVMPFRNFAYTGERLFPVAKSDADFEFRAWVNYSTSIDRVFTISYSKDWGYQGKLLEIIANKTGKHKKDRTVFRQINIEPHSGFEKFIAKVDSLNLINTSDQANFTSALHKPFSLYVIEIKTHGKVNQFRFNTHFPEHEDVEKEYQRIEDLLFSEFNFKFYFPNVQQSDDK